MNDHLRSIHRLPLDRQQSSSQASQTKLRPQIELDPLLKVRAKQVGSPEPQIQTPYSNLQAKPKLNLNFKLKLKLKLNRLKKLKLKKLNRFRLGWAVII